MRQTILVTADAGLIGSYARKGAPLNPADPDAALDLHRPTSLRKLWSTMIYCYRSRDWEGALEAELCRSAGHNARRLTIGQASSWPRPSRIFYFVPYATRRGELLKVPLRHPNYITG